MMKRNNEMLRLLQFDFIGAVVNDDRPDPD